MALSVPLMKSVFWFLKNILIDRHISNIYFVICFKIKESLRFILACIVAFICSSRTEIFMIYGHALLTENVHQSLVQKDLQS